MTATIGTAQRFALATVCAVAVSTVYAIQPVLEVAGTDLGLARGALGWLVAAGQVGYLLGLLLLVPLGDLLDRRTLITGQLLLVALAAGLAAVAPNAVTAVAALLVAGLFATVVQTTVAYVAAMSPAGERGRNIGAVTSGVVIGILGARVVAGVLGAALGWRSIYAVLGALCLVLAGTTWRMLARDTRAIAAGYVEVLARTSRLVRTGRLFRSRGVITFFLFASFGTLWSGLTLRLSDDPWRFGPATIGLFGLVGLAGALGAARAGRWADRGHAQSTTGWSLALLAASWLLVARTDSTLWLLIAGIVILDFAVQAVHVSSQHLLTTAHPDHASGVIGAYMAFYSVGSALGAVTTSWAYAAGGWSASCLAGAVFALAGLAVWFRYRRVAATSVSGTPTVR